MVGPNSPVSADEILQTHEWLTARDERMVVGSDLDALLSATFMSEFYDWEIVGFYTESERLYATPDAGSDELRDAVWLDLDVNHPEVRCVGHHLVTCDPDDSVPGHEDTTLNPNLFADVHHGSDASSTDIRSKYPLGTVHLLQWLTGRGTDVSDDHRRLLLMADSAWILGQSEHYRRNVGAWIREAVSLDYLESSFEEFDSPRFEESMDPLYETFADHGITPDGQKDSTGGRTGIKAGFDDPVGDRERVESVFRVIESRTGWTTPEIPALELRSRGRRKTTSWKGGDAPFDGVSEMLAEYGSLERFLSAEDVFSYAFPFRGHVNYTTDIDI